MIRIDYGSGYNPQPGYKTCDITESPFLDYISKDNKIFDKEGEVADETIDEIFCRNVIHHVKDLKNLFDNFYRYLKKGGRFVVVEPRKEFFHQNVILDSIWYRWFDGGKRNVWFSSYYRDYTKIACDCGFTIASNTLNKEKECYLFIKY